MSHMTSDATPIALYFFRILTFFQHLTIHDGIIQSCHHLRQFLNLLLDRFHAALDRHSRP
jgi:hypothetical protein